MEQYGRFAYVYDELMKDVDYEKWVDYIEKLIEVSNSDVKNILELACGTGNLTIPLAKRGYDIAGIDISEEMLEVALHKSEIEKTPLVLLQQDIVELDFDIYDIDCVLCGCDGFNYITSLKDLKSVFLKVYDLLKKGGVFIFDISSYYKLSKVLGNNFMGDIQDEISYMWSNVYDDDSQLLEMDLCFFVKAEFEEDLYDTGDRGEEYNYREKFDFGVDEDLGISDMKNTSTYFDSNIYEDGNVKQDIEENLYEKYTEKHLQRAHKASEIENILREIGFIDINIFSDFELSYPKEDSERIFFVAKK